MSVNKREKLGELVEGFDNAMLVTRDRDERLQARPMNIAEHDEATGRLTFASSAGDEKIEELRAHPSVCVAFQAGARYVSLTGHATVNQDRARIHALYEESWKLWFPDGPDQADICLIDIVPDAGEYWDTSGTEGLSFVWKAAKGYVTGEGMDPHADEHHGQTRL